MSLAMRRSLLFRRLALPKDRTLSNAAALKPAAGATTFDGLEPTEPLVKTAFPGPESSKMLAEMSKIQVSDAIQFFVDYNKSIGNYQLALLSADVYHY